MAERQTYGGLELTRHIATVRLYFGRSAAHWWRFYGLIAVLWFLLVVTYTRYLELFDDIESRSAAYQEFVMVFSGSGLLILVPAVAAFIWWAAGALTRYSRWQLRQPVLWRWFWVVVVGVLAVVGIVVAILRRRANLGASHAEPTAVDWYAELRRIAGMNLVASVYVSFILWGEVGAKALAGG